MSEIHSATISTHARAEDEGEPLSDRIDKVKKAATPAVPKVSWREILKIHPAANEIRPANDEERRTLRGDLQKNGQVEPVVMVTIAGGPEQLLDGRTRLDLLEANGGEVIDAAGKLTINVKVRTVELPDDAAALTYALSLNLYRRHLSLNDRRKLLVKVLKSSPVKSDRQVGKIVGLSHTKVSNERKKLEATGDVATVAASTDTVGRKQPRKRAPAAADPDDSDTAAALVKRAEHTITNGSPPTEPVKAPVVSDNVTDDDESDDDDQTIWRRGLMHRAEEAIGGAAFEDWSQFKTDRQLVEVVRQAADAWEKLATYLETEVLASDQEEEEDEPSEPPKRRQAKSKVEPHKDSLAVAVAAAFEELSELGSEYREIVDNAPGNLAESELNQTRAATADILEELQEPGVPAALADIEVIYTTTLPARKGRPLSRASRAANAFGILTACTEVLEAIPETDARHDAAGELLAELSNATEAEMMCEFPGMFG